MTIEEVVCARLLALSSVTALVGTRVYMLRLPQRPTLPAIRVQQISERNESHLRGVTNLIETRVQVDACAPESSGSDPYAAVMAVADAIEGNWLGASPPNGLSGWQATAGGIPPTIEVLHVERVNRRPMYEGEEFRQVRVQQDYIIRWKRLA